MAKEATVNISDFNKGGLADSRWSGVANSFFKMTGLDPHSTPGLLKVAQKMSKISSTTITAFCKESVVSSNGHIYWFSYTDGKIWQQNISTDTFLLVHTTTPAAGGAGCLGAIEYQGIIYWATESRLHKITALANDTEAEWTSNATEDFATFTSTDSLFHPMIELNGVLYIGDGNLVAQVDTLTFSANVLDISDPLRIKALGKIGTELLVGTWISDNITQTEIIKWNTYSVSFDVSDQIPEVGINAFVPADNFVLVQAGLAGNIYSYNGSQLELYKNIPGDYSPTKYGTVNPSSVANVAGQILMGFSNGTGNPADQGVYRLARHDTKYPLIMDFPYPISERSGGALVVSSLEIGAIAAAGFNVYVAWKNGSTYGVDKLDYSNKMELAYFETRIMSFNRDKLSTLQQFCLNYYEIPESCAITLSYDKNYAGYVDFDVITDTGRLSVITQDKVEASVVSVKAEFTVSGNTAPSIEDGEVVLL